MDSVQDLINNFNRPYQRAVAINCEHIGDDNDYSCFLSNVVEKLLPVDAEMAYRLFKTDPFLTVDLSFEQFKAYFNKRICSNKL
jgi:hypothetical protein